MAGVTVTGQCPRCSYGERLVLHYTAWCPRIPAVLDVSTQDQYTNCRHDDAMFAHDYAVYDGQCSRPAQVGEIAWLVDDSDGPDMPFGTWVRVIERSGDRIVVHPIGDGWCYVREEAT